MNAFMIRPAVLDDVEGIAKVHVDVWNSTYTGIVPQAFLDGRTYENKRPQWQRTLGEPLPKHHVLVAVDAVNQVIGFSSGGMNRNKAHDFDGEIFAIYLFKKHQGTGIGRKLFQASMERLTMDGFSSMLLWVLEDNPTCRFYEAMGGKVCGEKIEDIGGKKLKELAYGWSSFNTVTDRRDNSNVCRA